MFRTLHTRQEDDAMFHGLFATGVAVLVATGAARAKDVGAADINYLATMYEQNKPYYEANVMGVARLFAAGTVVSVNKIENGVTKVVIDVKAGNVQCLNPSGVFHVGDKVSVTGNVGGAETAGSIARFNEMFPASQSPNKNYVADKAVDTLSLITGSCSITR
jgi:hypothetical protein